MVSQRKSALQRIQVGAVGLIGVLGFVTLANFMIDRSFLPGNAETKMQVNGQQNGNPKPSDEPLAEIGVAPTVEGEQNAEQNMQPKPLQRSGQRPQIQRAPAPF
jgi:hypothetical protein